MKLLRHGTLSLLKSVDGKILTIRPDEYVEPLPDVGMIQIAVESNQTITLPTPNLTGTAAYIDLFMGIYDVYNGTVLQTDDNGGGLNQPQITRTLLANTEYYIKITGVGGNKEGQYNILVTGNGTAVPTTEVGIKSMIVGTTLVDQYQPYNGAQWYKFKTTAAGNYIIRTLPGTYENYNYDIDWNDGTTVTGVTSWNDPKATHVYATKGIYVIYLRGTVPGFSVNNTGNMKLSITRVISWGNIGLRKIDFFGCTALTTLPDQVGKLSNVYTFLNFCNGCTSLVGIPYGTFFGSSSIPISYATSFASAFYNCQSLRTINSTTFRDMQNVNSFASTFANCIKLITLPDLLFINCYRNISWSNCFGACTTLTTLPTDLFYRSMSLINYANVMPSTMDSCFIGCTSLTTIPNELFSSSQIDNLGINKIKGTSFNGIFSNCILLNNLPPYIFHNQIYATTFSGVFYYCTSLVETPISCFEGCTAGINFGDYQTYNISGITYVYTYGIFGGCTVLTKVNNNLFKECSSATNYACVFYGCTNLTTLCPNLFDDSPLVTNFSYTFYSNYKLSSWAADPILTNYQLSADLFKYNTKVTTFFATFYYCKMFKDLPEILFKNCVDVITFGSTFSYCSTLAILPPKLFRYNNKVITFNQTFYGCTLLSKIPIITESNIDYGFFYFNPLVKSFCYTFTSCGLSDSIGPIYAIPAITFLGNTEVTGTIAIGGVDQASFYGTFSQNTLLQSIPDQLFVNCTKANDFANTFQGCTNINLTSIPANLFIGNQNADTFASTFSGCSNITSIPAELFQNCVRVSNFSGCFQATKISSIPSTLFSYSAGSVQNFTGTFSSCFSLTSIGIDLFKYNINVTTFANCFSGCSSLMSAPQDLFKYNTISASFYYVFGGCTLLDSIGTGIFKYASGGINFAYAFYQCYKVKLEPTIFSESVDKATRFINKSTDFTYCFYRGGYYYTNTVMSTHYTYLGAAVNIDDNSSVLYQPLISWTSLLANTEYYVKIYGFDTSTTGMYNILVTGDGAAIPSTTAGVTNLIVGSTLTNQTLLSAGNNWYKFKTTAAGTYTIKTIINSTFEQKTVPDLWNYTFNYTPIKTMCYGGAGNAIENLSNYADIPTVWKT